ncbi:argininosuccinate synthase [Syntrophus gentianae]|uniref:argininosuccinate synthase n=1 Tax=Syntrophus gentianae TaxID=43775 RepID=A0A1H8ABN1_9BACT|nr:argininosuccinate synthase domain-containing protein [Syntrophus gentianae]SEM68130.1 argininosuccinate synthase [Syntrophus gentianae]
MIKKNYRAVALYSGGVDSTVAPLLALEDLGLQREEMLLLYVDLGGFANRKSRAEQRAKVLGLDYTSLDGRADFARNFLSQAILMNGSYWGYPLITPLSRAYIVEAAAAYLTFEGGETRYLINGCTRYQNTRYRIEKHCTLHPHFIAVTPFKYRYMTRQEKIEVLQQYGMTPGKSAGIAEDENLWGRALEGGPLNDLDDVEAKGVFHVTQDFRSSSLPPDRLSLRFADGLPIAIDSKSMSLHEIIEQCAIIGAKHGVGRIVVFEDTIPELGYKERGVYESPASAILYAAHQFIEDAVLTLSERVLKRDMDQQWAEIVYRGGWYDANRRELSDLARSFHSKVSGEVTVEVFLGHVRVLNADIPNCKILGPQAIAGHD